MPVYVALSWWFAANPAYRADVSYSALQVRAALWNALSRHLPKSDCHFADIFWPTNVIKTAFRFRIIPVGITGT